MVYIQHNSQYSATSCDNRGNKLHVKFLLKFKYNQVFTLLHRIRVAVTYVSWVP